MFAGQYVKLSKSMFVFNITTPIEKFSKLTGELGFMEEQNRIVALVHHSTGDTGFEVKFQVQSTNDFDVKLYLATPIEVLQKVLVLGILKPEKVRVMK